MDVKEFIKWADTPCLEHGYGKMSLTDKRLKPVKRRLCLICWYEMKEKINKGGTE